MFPSELAEGGMVSRNHISPPINWSILIQSIRLKSFPRVVQVGWTRIDHNPHNGAIVLRFPLSPAANVNFNRVVQALNKMAGLEFQAWARRALAACLMSPASSLLPPPSFLLPPSSFLLSLISCLLPHTRSRACPRARVRAGCACPVTIPADPASPLPAHSRITREREEQPPPSAHARGRPAGAFEAASTNARTPPPPPLPPRRRRRAGWWACVYVCVRACARARVCVRVE